MMFEGEDDVWLGRRLQRYDDVIDAREVVEARESLSSHELTRLDFEHALRLTVHANACEAMFSVLVCSIGFAHLYTQG